MNYFLRTLIHTAIEFTLIALICLLVGVKFELWLAVITMIVVHTSTRIETVFDLQSKPGNKITQIK